MENRPRFKCSMCFYSTVAHRQLVCHYVRNHRHDPRFFVKCNYYGCGSTYSKWWSYKKHVQREHREENQHFDGDMGPLNNQDEMPEVIEGENIEDDNNIELNDHGNLQWHAAKFILNIRDVCKTSHNAVQKVMEGVESLLGRYSQLLMEELRKSADPQTRSVSLDTISDTFNSRIPVSSIFEPVNSKHKLDAFMVDKFDMIVPEEVTMGSEYVWQRKPVPDLVEKKFCGYIIPFLKALKRLLSNRDVRCCVENPLLGDGNNMKTVLDGANYKNHPIYARDRNSLAIIMYYDEVEFCNPLGSKTHKLGMFYWTLANIHPELRSSMQAINLLAIASYKLIVKFEISELLKDFITGIKTLHNEGVTVLVNGENKIYRGSLLMITADTPASAFMGGLKRSVSASKPCRTCMTDQAMLRNTFIETSFVRRNMNDHMDHVEAVSQPNVQQQVLKFWKQMYGVNERSIFLDIPHIDFIAILVQDIMHVLSEGVVEVAMREFISFLVTNGLITLQTLNNKVAVFDYRHLSKDKPSPMLPAHLQNSLRQSASQMLCLCYILPFLINDVFCDPDMEAHESFEAGQRRMFCHARLLQILNICFAYEIRSNDANYLGHLINIYNTEFNALYPNALVPKFHFLIHVVSQIKNFGPLRQHFCMRFEAAHSWYKSICKVTRNFKNLPWTFAYRNESLRCSQLAKIPGGSSSKFLYQGHQIHNGTRVLVRFCPVADLLFALLNNVDIGSLAW